MLFTFSLKKNVKMLVLIVFIRTTGHGSIFTLVQKYTFYVFYKHSQAGKVH